MSYFKEENFRGASRLPSSFMAGFLEVRSISGSRIQSQWLTYVNRVATRVAQVGACVYIYLLDLYEKGHLETPFVSLCSNVNAHTL